MNPQGKTTALHRGGSLHFLSFEQSVELQENKKEKKSI